MQQDNLHQAGELSGHLPGLLLEAEKVAQNFMKGVHGRRRTGMGEAFWQFRPYQPGDAPREIDWRQTAKRDHAFVRQTEWEAAQTVWLYRDPSLSMDFRSDAKFHSKKDYAEILMLALGMILLSGGEQVSLLGTSLAPQTGYAAIQRIHEMLSAQKGLQETGRPISSKSYALIFSDFYFPLPELSSFCEKLAERHVQGMLVQVFDPAERALPYGGRIKFEDIESPGSAVDIQQVDAIRAEYAEKFEAHQEAVATLAKGCGWKSEKLATDISLDTAITQLYDILSPKG